MHRLPEGTGLASESLDADTQSWIISDPRLRLDAGPRIAFISRTTHFKLTSRLGPRSETRAQALVAGFRSAAGGRDHRLRRFPYRAEDRSQHAHATLVSPGLGHRHGHYAAGMLRLCRGWGDVPQIRGAVSLPALC